MRVLQPYINVHFSQPMAIDKVVNGGGGCPNISSWEPLEETTSWYIEGSCKPVSLGQWLRKPKRENFKLKIPFFRLLRNWMHKLQCNITIFASLTISSRALVSISLYWNVTLAWLSWTTRCLRYHDGQFLKVKTITYSPLLSGDALGICLACVWLCGGYNWF